jgi:hypothetical protein
MTADCRSNSPQKKIHQVIAPPGALWAEWRIALTDAALPGQRERGVRGCRSQREPGNLALTAIQFDAASRVAWRRRFMARASRLSG